MTFKPGEGRHRIPEYGIWKSMRQRCNNPKSAAYHRYGGRGIGIHESWNDFFVFIADMGARPSLKHSIERIDNDKGYGPDNCRWATSTEQARNRRKGEKICVRGVALMPVEWASKSGLPLAVILRRRSLGWSPEKIVSTPSAHGRGDKHPSAKLNARRVIEMRCRHSRGETFADLSREFGITDANARRAILGITWRHV